jgi:hypothetical protein
MKKANQGSKSDFE